MKPGKTGLARIIDATRFSMAGMRAAWKNEAAFRQEIVICSILFVLSFFLAANPVQWLLLVAPLLIVLVVELLNSAVESIVDRIGPEHHELSGRSKDMGSAAVFFSLLLVFLCWVTVAWTNFS